MQLKLLFNYKKRQAIEKIRFETNFLERFIEWNKCTRRTIRLINKQDVSSNTIASFDRMYIIIKMLFISNMINKFYCMLYL